MACNEIITPSPPDVAFSIGASMASPCHYKNGYTTYTPAPVYTHNVTYNPYYNGY